LVAQTYVNGSPATDILFSGNVRDIHQMLEIFHGPSART
jgi:hypothetical protein